MKFKLLIQGKMVKNKDVRGGSRISGKGFHMYKGVGVRFADLSHFFFIIYPLTETKLFHFHRIFKNGVGEGPNPLWIRHWMYLALKLSDVVFTLLIIVKMPTIGSNVTRKCHNHRSHLTHLRRMEFPPLIN